MGCVELRRDCVRAFCVCFCKGREKAGGDGAFGVGAPARGGRPTHIKLMASSALKIFSFSASGIVIENSSSSSMHTCIWALFAW